MYIIQLMKNYSKVLYKFVLLYFAKSLKIISKPCQLQKGINDCGVFAIAAALIVSGLDPSKLNYNQELMRNHLNSCFYLKMFPCLKDVVNKTIKKIENINLICDCRQPNYSSWTYNPMFLL